MNAENPQRPLERMNFQIFIIFQIELETRVNFCEWGKVENSNIETNFWPPSKEIFQMIFQIKIWIFNFHSSLGQKQTNFFLQN